MENTIKTAREIGLRLRRIRMARNMSQQALADLVPTSPQNISKYEKDGVSNIETIQRLSAVLGHDLLTDETDAEGTVGVIGKEILHALAANRGMLEVEDLTEQYMFGMSADRVTREIFKLERIGMCVREQYRNYYEEEKDSLFLTAKGVIYYRNECTHFLQSEEEQELLNHIKTFETRLRGYVDEETVEFGSYQEMLDANPLERMVRNIPQGSFYRVNYIQWLKKHFQSGPDAGEGIIKEDVVSSVDCYYDILFRMAMDITDPLLETIYDEGAMEADEEMYELESFLSEEEELVRFTKQRFDKAFPHLKKRVLSMGGILRTSPDMQDESDPYDPADEEGMNEPEIDEEMEARREEARNRLGELCGDALWADSYIVDLEGVFAEAAKEHGSLDPTEWFTPDEIRDFVENELCRNESPEMWDYLIEMNQKFPETTGYYEFPKAWWENGLAEFILEKFHVPMKPADSQQ